MTVSKRSNACAAVQGPTMPLFPATMMSGWCSTALCDATVISIMRLGSHRIQALRRIDKVIGSQSCPLQRQLDSVRYRPGHHMQWSVRGQVTYKNLSAPGGF